LTTEPYKIIREEGSGKIVFKMGDVEGRYIMMGNWAMNTLLESFKKNLGDEADALLYDAGLDVGSSSAQFLIEMFPDMDFTSVEFWDMETRMLGEGLAGWFKIEDISFGSKNREAMIKVSDSFTTHGIKNSPKPVCHFVSGYFAGLIGGIFGKDHHSEQLSCQSMGDPYCVFRVQAI